MNVEDVRRFLLQTPSRVRTPSQSGARTIIDRRLRYPVLIDRSDGQPPRRVLSLEWDDDHQALIVGTD